MSHYCCKSCGLRYDDCRCSVVKAIVKEKPKNQKPTQWPFPHPGDKPLNPTPKPLRSYLSIYKIYRNGCHIAMVAAPSKDEAKKFFIKHGKVNMDIENLALRKVKNILVQGKKAKIFKL